MRFPRIATLLAVLAVAALVTPTAEAQNFGQRQYSGPFVDFDEFNPDYQFFAPLDNTHFGDFTPNMGWYFTWDKLFLKSARPRDEESYGGFDRGSGTESMSVLCTCNNGWYVSTTRLGGPNFYDELIVERNNRIQEDDQGGGGGGGGNNNDEQTPTQDDNNPLTGQRDYILRDSINSLN